MEARINLDTLVVENSASLGVGHQVGTDQGERSIELNTTFEGEGFPLRKRDIATMFEDVITEEGVRSGREELAKIGIDPIGEHVGIGVGEEECHSPVFVEHDFVEPAMGHGVGIIVPDADVARQIHGHDIGTFGDVIDVDQGFDRVEGIIVHVTSSGTMIGVVEDIKQLGIVGVGEHVEVLEGTVCGVVNTRGGAATDGT